MTLAPARLRAAVLVVGLFHLALAPSSASAQAGPSTLLPELRTNPKSLEPGAWVKYSIYYRKTGRGVVVKVTALEREKPGQWVEIAMTSRGQQPLVVKALVKGSLAKPGEVVRAVLQPPGHQPLLLPTKLARKQAPVMRKGPEPSGGLVGSERVKVAAGTFTARHFRRRTKAGVSEAWFSREVPGWSMVKAKSPELVLELAGFGTKGRSQIQGKPGKLDERLLRRLGIIQ